MDTLLWHRRSLIVATAAIWIGATLPARALNSAAVIAPVQQLLDGLLKVMKVGSGTPFATRYDMLAPVIDQTFDLAAILQE